MSAAAAEDGDRFMWALVRAYHADDTDAWNATLTAMTAQDTTYTFLRFARMVELSLANSFPDVDAFIAARLAEGAS